MRNIVLGMPTLIELETLLDNVKLCKELGLNFIEINMNLPQFQMDKIDIMKLQEIQRENDIFFTFHLPEELDIATFNMKVRLAYLDIIKETIEVSKILCVPIINMHLNLGVYFTLPSAKIYLYHKYINEFLDSINSFGELVETLIGDEDIVVAIENTGIYEVDFIVEAIKLLLKRKCFKLTWDIGHDHSSEYKDKVFIMDNINKLKHMHIHDALGKSNHLPVFTGEIDIIDRLKIAKETKSRCVLETKTVAGLKESATALKQKGFL